MKKNECSEKVFHASAHHTKPIFVELQYCFSHNLKKKGNWVDIYVWANQEYSGSINVNEITVLKVSVPDAKI